MVLFFYQFWPGELYRLIVRLYIVCILCVYILHIVYCIFVGLYWFTWNDVLLHIYMFVRSLAIFLYYF